MSGNVSLESLTLKQRVRKQRAAQLEALACVAPHGSTDTHGDGPPHRFPFFPKTRHQQPEQPPPRLPARRTSPRLGQLLPPPRRAGGTSDVDAAAFPHAARYRSRRTVRRNSIAAGHRQAACGAWSSAHRKAAWGARSGAGKSRGAWCPRRRWRPRVPRGRALLPFQCSAVSSSCRLSARRRVALPPETTARGRTVF